jgi:uncharacterized protein
VRSSVSLTIASLSIILLGSAAHRPSPISLAGAWVGEVQMAREWQFAMLWIEEDHLPLTGALEFPFAGKRLPFSHGENRSNGLRLIAGDSGDRLELVGTIRDRFLEGTIRGSRTGGDDDRFAFAHLAELDLNRLTAAYEYDGGHLISLSPIPDDSLGPLRRYMLQYTDTGTGRFGALFSLSDGRLIGGGPALRVFPVELRVSASRTEGAEVTALTWRDRDRSAVQAVRLAGVREEEITFANGEAKLAGTLTRRTSGTPSPAVVLTHGSGPQYRQRGVIEQLFVRAGFAVLTYDKRGVGGSTGDRREASFEDLADDAVAGARMLESREDIDGTRIGFWGLSQGAWIAPLAAVKFGKAAFVVAASGGGLSPERQELLDTDYRLQVAGFGADDIAEAIAFQRAKDAFMRTGEGWTKYKELRDRAVTSKWYGYGEASGPGSPNDPFWSRQRRIYFYEPAAALRMVNCPVLFVFGALDTPTAVKENVSVLRQSLGRGENGDVTISVVPNAGHNLFLNETDSFSALTKQRLQYAPGYPEAFVAWAEERTKAK